VIHLKSNGDFYSCIRGVCTLKHENENVCSISSKEMLALELKVTFSSIGLIPHAPSYFARVWWLTFFFLSFNFINSMLLRFGSYLDYCRSPKTFLVPKSYDSSSKCSSFQSNCLRRPTRKYLSSDISVQCLIKSFVVS
jgi:hypothetical protein